ncbi:hypothetical protein EDB85DRAFT_2256199 [Lactarius pseudohatsudake]|nr:hypothetical protein EDB85DRAFT_2256199 [Lactarius pseudohatsudake]
MPPSWVYGVARHTCVQHPSAQMGKGRARSSVPLRAPFPHVRGGTAKGKGYRGRCARMHPFRPNGEGWSRGWRALTFPVQTGWHGQGGREVPGAACPHAPPLLCEWGREGPGGCACPRVPPFRANGEKAMRRGSGVPSCAPLLREWGRERGGQPRVPLSVRTGQRRQEGRGGAGGNMPLCSRFPRAADREKSGGGSMPSCATLPRKRGGADRGEGTREAEGRWVCAPYLRAKGGAAVNAGERGWEERRGGCVHTQYGGKEGRVVLDPVTEATRACHVSASVKGGRTRACRPPSPSSPLPPVHVTLFAQKERARNCAQSYVLAKRQTQDFTVTSPITKNRWHNRWIVTPPPLLPVAPGPPLPSCPRCPFAQKVHTRTGRHPLSLSPQPPFGFAQKECAQGHTTPGPTPSLFVPPRSRGKGAREGTRNPPASLFPICVEGGVNAGMPPPAPPFPLGRGAPYAWEGGT